MKVEAIMAETELTTAEILNLKENDIIVFNKNASSSSATIYINKKEKFSAVSGISNNRKAVQIKANLDREKQETLDTLREMREDREQKAKESAETLKKLLNERTSNYL
ncbi:FliM/FliN family flagellar motor switch protein [Aliarcobacter butzleri]|nr:FliM/FliN family flagellar motor switch protein [Aliarcobacter butzleri]